MKSSGPIKKKSLDQDPFSQGKRVTECPTLLPLMSSRHQYQNVTFNNPVRRSLSAFFTVKSAQPHIKYRLESPPEFLQDNAMIFTSTLADNMMQNIFVNEGNLGADPILKYVPVPKENGTEPRAVVEFDIYCSVQKLNKKGEYDDIGGSWAKIELWGKRAEYLHKHLKKGCRVLVVGEYAQHWYLATKGEKAGQEVASNEVTASHVGLVLLGVESVVFENRKSKTIAEDKQTSDSLHIAEEVPQNHTDAHIFGDSTLQH